MSEEDNRPKVLVVDDSPFTLMIIQAEIELLGYVPFLAEGHKLAFELIDEHCFDLILLDVQMPDKTGYEICQELKQNKSTKHIPVIFLSALIERDSIIKGLNSGAVDYLCKPLIIAEFRQKIINHIEISLSRKQLAIELEENKRKSIALAKSEKKFRDFIEKSLECFAIVDLDGSIIEANQAFCVLIGYSKSELLQLKYTDITVKKFNDLEEKIIEEQVYKNGFSELYQKEYIRKDGTIVPVELIANLWEFDGEIKGIYGFIRDISKRKEIEYQLTATNQMLAQIINTIPVHVFWKDTNSVYLGCNEIFAKIAGKNSSAEVIGKKDNELIWLKEAEIHRRQDITVINFPSKIQEFVIQQTRNNSQKIWVKIIKVPLTDFNNNVIGVLGISQDINEQVLNQEKNDKNKIILENILVEKTNKLSDISKVIKVFISLLPVAIISFDLEGIILETNDAFCKQLDCQHSDLLHKNFYSLIQNQEAAGLIKSELFNESYIKDVQIAFKPSDKKFPLKMVFHLTNFSERNEIIGYIT